MRTATIEAILVNYDVLCKLLVEVNESGRDEYAMKAGGYLSSIDRFSTYFGLNYPI